VGAWRVAHNWAVRKIQANAAPWTAEGSYDIPKTERVRPLTYFTWRSCRQGWGELSRQLA